MAISLARAFQAQFPLVLPLVEIVEGHHRQSESERAVGISGKGVHLVEGGRHAGIRAQIGRDLLGLGLLNGVLTRCQGWIAGLEPGLDLLPGQRRLRAGARGEANRHQQPYPKERLAGESACPTSPPWRRQERRHVK
jgi:hypothetical protein